MSSRGPRRVAWGLVVGVLLAAGLALAGVAETAKAKSVTGTPVVVRAGQTSNVGSTTQFQAGDVLRVPADESVTVEFSDGASVTLVGPAVLLFGPMEPTGRRVVLVSGAISKADVRGVALEIQAPQPIDASLVLQNAVGFARVAPGDRVVFQKLSGSLAKVWRGGVALDLGDRAWQLNLRDNTTSLPMTGAAAAGAAVAGQAGETVTFKLGQREISYTPAGSFTKTSDPATGSVTLRYSGPDFGVVIVGRDTNLFLADGESVTFNGEGYVMTFDGIAHIYPPLSFSGVDFPSDASQQSPVRR
jgi:hypothetical protein